MTARTGFLTEDFAGRVLVICFPSFRVSPVLPASVPFLKTCKFGSWLSFGVSLAPLLFSFCRLHLCLSTSCWSGRAQHSPGPGTHPVSPLQGNQSCSQQTKSVRSHTPWQRQGHTVLWLSFITDLYSSWTSTVSKAFSIKEASLQPCILSRGWKWRLFFGGAPLGALHRSNVLAHKLVNLEELGCRVNADS